MSTKEDIELVIFGSAIVDFICYVERLPKAGETLHGTEFTQGFGGKGANQCVAAARLGARVAMVAKLGDDAWGQKYLKQLNDEGVSTDHVQCCINATTGIAQICVAANGENHIVIVAGANNLLCSDDLASAKNIFAQAKILICQLEVPLDVTLLALQQFKKISILNAAPALANPSRQLLSAAAIFCINETEAAVTLNINEEVNLSNAKCIVRRIIEMGANTVIITLGAAGAVYGENAASNRCIHVNAPHVDRVVDTTGAGDAFIGALAFYMVRYPELPLHQHIGGACEVAAISVQHSGTQSSFPFQQDIAIDLMKRQFTWTEL